MAAPHSTPFVKQKASQNQRNNEQQLQWIQRKNNNKRKNKRGVEWKANKIKLKTKTQTETVAGKHILLSIWLLRLQMYGDVWCASIAGYYRRHRRHRHHTERLKHLTPDIWICAHATIACIMNPD